MRCIQRLLLASFILIALGCAKSQEGASETAAEPESLYKGQTDALEKAKDLEQITEKSLKKKARTLDGDTP